MSGIVAWRAEIAHSTTALSVHDLCMSVCPFLQYVLHVMAFLGIERLSIQVRIKHRINSEGICSDEELHDDA